MSDPIEGGQPAAGGEGQGQDPVAVAGQQPATTTPETTPNPQQPANPTNQQPGTKEPTVEELKRRLEGQDRLIRSLKGRRTQTPVTPGSEDGDAELENLRVFKAEAQLKDATKEILDSYPDFPKQIAQAILKNPRGFIASTTQTVDDAVIDLQEYIANVWDEFIAQQQSTTPGQQPVVAAPNAGVTSEGKPDIENMSAEEIDAAVKAGTLTEADLENFIREKSHKK